MRGFNHGGWRKSWVAISAATLLISTLLHVSIAPAGAVAEKGTTTRASTTAANAQAAGVHNSPALSADGTYVAFTSPAALVAADTNGVGDVYRKNIATGAVDLVSVGVGGAAGNAQSGTNGAIDISADGNFVSFESEATNLVAGDTNGKQDVFLRNITGNSTARVNVGIDGQQSSQGAIFPSLSDGGNRVAFVDYGGLNDHSAGVYVFDTSTGVATFITSVAGGAPTSISGDGVTVSYVNTTSGYRIEQQTIPGDGVRVINSSDSYAPAASLLGPNASSVDGSSVAFWSDQADLAGPGGFDQNSQRDVFVDTDGAIANVAVNEFGIQANSGSGYIAGSTPSGAISADGRYVNFLSGASNMSDGAVGAHSYVFDRSAGLPLLVSVTPSGAPANSSTIATTISPNGGQVAFASYASDIVANDTNGTPDVFVRARDLSPTPYAVRLFGATTTEPGFSRLSASDVPPTALPLDSLSEVSGAPLRSIDMAAAPLRSIPLRSIPLRSIPLRSIPLRSITLSQLPLKAGTWEAILATLNPNPFIGVPLQAITLDQVLDANPPGLNSISLSDVDLSATPLRSIAMASILLGATPLRSIPVEGASADVFTNWCSVLTSLGFSCAALGLNADSSVLAVDLAGVPLRSIPLRSIPLRSINLSAAPLRSIPLRSINFESAVIGGLLLNKIDPAKRATIVDCSAPTDCANGTLADAARDNHIVAGATLGTLFDAVNANDLPGSLGELLAALIDVTNYPWESLTLDGLQPYAGELARRVTYQATYKVGGEGTAAATIAVDLPKGFRYVEGSTGTHDDGMPEPVANGEHVVWTISEESGGTTRTFSFDAYPGFDLESSATSRIAVTMGSVTSARDGEAPVQVVEDFENRGCEIECFGEDNNFPTTAPIISPNALLVSHIGNSGDVDYYRLPVPPKGTRIQIKLGNHSTDADFDVAMLNDTASTPLRSIPLRSIPLRSIPLVDNGVDASAATSSLSPETLNDIPIGAAPLRSIGENRGTADELLTTTSDANPSDGDGTQYYTLQVTAFNAGHSDSPYVLYVKEYEPPTPPACPAPRTFPFAGQGVPGLAPTSLPANLNTLYLVNRKRMGDTFGAVAATNTINALQSITDKPAMGVSGVVYPVESNANVAAALASWDADPCSPQAANAAFTEISAIVDSVRAQRPTLKNIVVVGGDDISPMARVADYTQISNESDYAASLLLNNGTNKGTPLSASAAGQNILTDDPLGDVDPIPWLDHSLYVPDLAVGRLVEKPADIIAQVNQFNAANGVLNPQTMLTTGYDFLADGSTAVDAAANNRIPAANRKTLINETWAKGDELAALFPAAGAPDVASLNAHYDHGRSLPALGNSTADESDLVTTADIAAHPQTLNKRLLFTMGCHAGLSVPEAYADANSPKAADWAQTYMGDQQKAAVYFANTGFGYGDTAAVALSEELMRQFTTRLDGSMTVGQAAVYAKQAYFGQLGAYGPYDEKAMQEAMFFGFPMWTIATPNAPVTPPAPNTTPAADANGILSAPKSITPTFQTKMSPGGGTFFPATAPNALVSGLQVTQYRPIVPRLSVDVTPAAGSVPAGTTPHGVLVTSLASHDVAGVPAVARPVIDLTSSEPPPPAGDVVFPTNFQNLTVFNTPQGERQHVVFLPDQFFRDASQVGAGGVQRLFDSIGTEVKYSNSTDFTPPQLTDIHAELASGNITISLRTFDNQVDNVKKVLVLVKDGSGNWTAHELAQDPDESDLYEAVFPATGTDFEYFAQSMDGAGNVGISTNKGRYFSALPASLSENPPTPGRLVLTPGHPNGTNGWYNTPVTVTLQGNPGVTYTKSVDGGAASAFTAPVSFANDGTHSVVAKGSDSSKSSAVVVIDKTKPAIVATASRAANSKGWYNAPVTIHFTCTDATSGIRSCPADQTVSTNGLNVPVTGTALDFAGNQATTTLKINMDMVAPTVAITGLIDGHSYTWGRIPIPSCKVTDALSGPDGNGCKFTVAGGSPNGTGLWTLTATGKDNAGNTGSKTITVKILYRWDGFSPPINDPAYRPPDSDDHNDEWDDDDRDHDGCHNSHDDDDHRDRNHYDELSIFKAGTTVPVVFQLKSSDRHAIKANSAPTFVTAVKLGKINGGINEKTYNDTATAGNKFVWDADAKDYTFNWKPSTSMAGYYWRIGVLLDDGTTHTVVVGLK
jgi:hypothetical protein